MFYDLNVLRPQEHEIPNLLQFFEKHGYSVIAFTTEVTDDIFVTECNGKKKKQNKDGPTVPKPLDVSKYSSKKITIYNRLNIIIDNPLAFHNISQSPIVKQYDLLSMQPGSDAILKTLSGMTNFEILSYNPVVEGKEVYFNRKTYKKFVSNGVFMELAYSYPILDSSNRRLMIQRAHVYQCVGGGGNVIVSSGANVVRRLRTPYDVIHLCFIFSLSEEQAKASITRNCEKVLLLARTRRRAKCAIEMTLVPTNCDTLGTGDQKKISDKKETTGGKQMKKRRLNDDNVASSVEAHPSFSVSQPSSSEDCVIVI